MKTMYLVRGLPNAGKTTLARVLTCSAVAADDYQVNEQGEYDFDPSRVVECHHRCAWQVRDWISDDVETIAVHNTFTQNWEMEPYVKMARKHGYRLVVITVERGHDGDNGHNVKPEHVAAMANRWEAFKNA